MGSCCSTGKQDDSVEVDLTGQGLKEIPKNLLSASKLEKLVMAKNNLTTIPREASN